MASLSHIVECLIIELSQEIREDSSTRIMTA
jgi:hypothetical protein